MYRIDRQPMTPLRRRYIDDLRLRNKSPRTIETYVLRVVQFSDEYFELAVRHGKKLSQYLVFDEPMCVNLDGQAYFIDPPTKE